MNAIEQLKSVLCDPTGKCCIKGSEEDRAIVDRALEALAQPEFWDGVDFDIKTTPPQRTWVGLTDEEVQLYAVQHRRMVNTHYDSVQNTNLITEEFDAPAFYKTIEAALRSKNT
jgi:hypothetical protein